MMVKIQAAFGIEYNGFSVAQRNERDLLLYEILNRLFDECRFWVVRSIMRRDAERHYIET